MGKKNGKNTNAAEKWIDTSALYYLNTVPVVSGCQLSVRGPEQGWEGHVKTVCLCSGTFVYMH